MTPYNRATRRQAARAAQHVGHVCPTIHDPSRPKVGPLVRIDHLQAIKSDSYKSRIVRELQGRTTTLDWWHEPEHSCCDLEPWETTLASIYTSQSTAAPAPLGDLDALAEMAGRLGIGILVSSAD
jgi:hypothetical protein